MNKKNLSSTHKEKAKSAAAKAAGHYTNAQLIKMEALAHGYVEAIALGPGGLVRGQWTEPVSGA